MMEPIFDKTQRNDGTWIHYDHLDDGSTHQHEPIAEALWSSYAGEAVTVEIDSKCTAYVFGSELACLRLFHRMLAIGRAEFSAKRDSWYYSQDSQLDALNTPQNNRAGHA